MKTISGREIMVSANRSKRSFTIRTGSAKYRTYSMCKRDFEDCEYYTANDWQNFLNSFGGYYIVKK